MHFGEIHSLSHSVRQSGEFVGIDTRQHYRLVPIEWIVLTQFDCFNRLGFQQRSESELLTETVTLSKWVACCVIWCLTVHSAIKTVSHIVTTLPSIGCCVKWFDPNEVRIFGQTVEIQILRKVAFPARFKRSSNLKVSIWNRTRPVSPGCFDTR